MIGVTQRIAVDAKTGEYRDCLAHDWGNYLNVVGVTWIPLPNRKDETLSLAETLGLSGILLTGGSDIGAHDMRDETEAALLEWTADNDVPLIGVCRGFQMIQHWLGGQLTDVDASEHVAKRHPVVLQSGERRDVNSFHARGIKKLAPGLTAYAFSERDGTIEAAKKNNMIGIMWHPERESEYKRNDIELFRCYFLGGTRECEE